MPDDSALPQLTLPHRPKCALDELTVGKPDSIGATVYEILFRGCDYAIYRSDRGVYVHFADDQQMEQAQRRAYALLCGQLCELRYLTAQMRASRLARVPFLRRLARPRDSLYDHNMAQALMLLMESAAQREAKQDNAAEAMENDAKAIATRALDMAVRRVTVDNTIRYLRACITFGIVCLALLLAIYSQYEGPYFLAALMGLVGAMFSVISRAQSFELKPCEDSGLNKWMGIIRISMGAIAGPILYLLLTTLFHDLVQSPAGAPMVAIVGFVGGFAERLVPNLIMSAADKMQSRAGTPVQAASA